MAHRVLATRIWGPAASALRRHPGALLPPRSRFLGTVGNQAKPQSNTNRTQQDSAYVSQWVSLLPQLEKFAQVSMQRMVELQQTKMTPQDSVYVSQLVSLLAELEKSAHGAQQRMVELQQFQRQKKKSQKLFGFTLAVVGITVFEATRV